MKLPESIIGIIIKRNYRDNHQKLFTEIEFPEMELQECISFDELTMRELVQGDQLSPNSLVLTSINESTIIFSFYLFNQDQTLEKLSKNSMLMRFYLNPEQQIYNFSIFEQGKLIRDNYSDGEHNEIGEPFEIEIQLTDKMEIIQRLISNMIGGNLSELSNEDYFIYKKKKSFLSRLFN